MCVILLLQAEACPEDTLPRTMAGEPKGQWKPSRSLKGWLTICHFCPCIFDQSKSHGQVQSQYLPKKGHGKNVVGTGVKKSGQVATSHLLQKRLEQTNFDWSEMASSPPHMAGWSSAGWRGHLGLVSLFTQPPSRLAWVCLYVDILISRAAREQAPMCRHFFCLTISCANISVAKARHEASPEPAWERTTPGVRGGS